MNTKLIIMCIFVCFFLIAAGNPAAEGLDLPVTASVEEGTYSGEIEVSLVKKEHPKKASDDIWYRFSGGTWVRYSSPIFLNSLAGETRTYILEASVKHPDDLTSSKENERWLREFTYTIDKTPPEMPAIQPPPGYYSDPPSIRWEKDKDLQLFVRLDRLQGEEENDNSHFKTYTGPLSLSGESGTVRVSAYAEDSAGNRSSLQQSVYVLSDEKKEQLSLQVHSPVQGKFANFQDLVVSSPGSDWIRYSFGDTDPARAGKRYDGPTRIERTGKVTVHLAAGKGESLTRQTVQFTVEKEGEIAYNGGYETGTFALMPDKLEGFQYRIGDDPNRSWADLRKTLLFRPLPGNVRYLPIWLRSKDAGDNRLFRILRIIDDRAYSVPRIQFFPGQNTEEVIVKIEAPESSKIFYTSDGSRPRRGQAKPYTKALRVTSEMQEGSSFTVRAVFYRENGRESPVASRTYSFDEKPPPVPLVRLEKPDNNPGAAEISLDNMTSSASYRYELSTRFFSNNNYQKSRSNLFSMEDFPLKLSVPYGLEASFGFRFASVDKNGNQSKYSRERTVTLDHNPPPPPSIEFENNWVVIDGEGSIFYAISDEGEQPSLIENRKRYSGPVSLPGTDGERTEYRITAVSRDSSGNISEVTQPESRIVDLRKPGVPSYSGPKNNALLNSPEVILRFNTRYQDESIVYEVSTSTGEEGAPSKPKNPGPGSPRTRSNLVLKPQDDKVTKYLIHFRSYLMEPERLGEVDKLAFTVDRESPEIKKILGIHDGMVSSKGITIDAELENENDIAYISLTTDSGVYIDPLGPEGIPLPYTINSNEGEEKRYFCRVAARDRAGNRQRDRQTYSFELDRKAPDPPRVVRLPDGGLSNRPLSLELESGSQKAYFLLIDGDAQKRPSITPEPYTRPIEITGEEGETKRYTLFTSSRDAAGNLSQSYRRYSLTIDREAPPLSDAPAISSNGDNRAPMIEWKLETDTSGYFRVRSGSSDTSGNFRKYDGPVQLKHLQADSVLEYYLQDAAGNRSPLGMIDVSGNRIKEAPEFARIENNAVYRDDVFVRLIGSNNELIRFETREDLDKSAEIPEVNAFSSVFGEERKFSAASGEELSIDFFAARFSEKGKRTSPVVHYQFVIDKKAPSKPKLSGIQDGSYFQNAVDVSFSKTEGDVYFRVLGEPGEKDFQLFSEPYRIDPEITGAYAVTVEAYRKDRAGNTSEMSRFTFYFDNDVIYVSSLGDDRSEGTRKKPVKSIERALEIARASGRSIIFLGTGEHRVNETLKINQDISFRGGFSSEWLEKGGSTRIVGGSIPEDGAPIIAIQTSETNFENLHIDGSSAKWRSILDFSDSQVSISNCRLKVGRNSMALNGHGGRLIVTDSNIVFDEPGSKSLLQLENVEASLLNSSIHKSTLVQEKPSPLRQNIALWKIHGGKLRIENSTIHAGDFKEAVYADASEIVIATSSIQMDNSLAQHTLLKLNSGSLTISDSLIESDSGPGKITGISLKDAEALVSDTAVQMNYASGIIGLEADNCSVRVLRSLITTGDASGYLYLVRTRGGDFTSFESRFHGQHTADYVGFSFRETEVLFLQNSVYHGSGEYRNIGISLEGNRKIRLINSILTAKESEKRSDYEASVSFAAEDPDLSKVVLIGNLFPPDRPAMMWGDEGEQLFRTTDDMNRADGSTYAGSIRGNLSEKPSDTFELYSKQPFDLSQGSSAVKGGIPKDQLLRFSLVEKSILNRIYKDDLPGDPTMGADPNFRPSP
ncbi:MAG: hypothetical protein K9L68_12345 [Spirochaetales bacterium]|nr:hypothetical protein [Spirochaetales bacterium]MCF7939382.1 hypothetical protein [Spirochaetales bacterium]